MQTECWTVYTLMGLLSEKLGWSRWVRNVWADAKDNCCPMCKIPEICISAYGPGLRHLTPPKYRFPCHHTGQKLLMPHHWNTALGPYLSFLVQTPVLGFDWHNMHPQEQWTKSNVSGVVLRIEQQLVHRTSWDLAYSFTGLNYNLVVLHIKLQLVWRTSCNRNQLV